MLQHYRWRDTGVLDRWYKKQAATMRAAFPKPHCSPKPDPVALEGRPPLTGRSLLPQIKPWETAEEAKASGLVV